MCQDPEISFVIMLPFKIKQSAYYLSSEQLFSAVSLGIFCFDQISVFSRYQSWCYGFPSFKNVALYLKDIMVQK